ncbi:hypothetical protein BACSTE_03662 [Bacteroides stercoris ATCC 43183]|uniref:Uncharacterized protein n=1 Tax=Bacteroides stercoris ATCC 43183 TaxID=449673 RepID=B0NVX9_BACSE|nr:hypothetical protein BACSTE_03662 [Bacteroides stercoris ATCC 43183]
MYLKIIRLTTTLHSTNLIKICKNQHTKKTPILADKTNGNDLLFNRKLPKEKDYS